MVKCEVIKDFNLEKFDELKEVERRNQAKKEKGKLYEGDTFKCDNKMAKYLTGNNENNLIVVKVIEVEPEVVSENEVEGTISYDIDEDTPLEAKVELKDETQKTTKKKKKTSKK